MRVSPLTRRLLVITGLVAGWASLPALAAFSDSELNDAILTTAGHVLHGRHGPVALEAMENRWAAMYVFALLCATAAAPLGLMARAYVRTRLHTTGRDFLAPLRARVAVPSWRLRALCTVPAAIGLALGATNPFNAGWPFDHQVAALVGMLPAGALLTVLVHKYLAVLAAPMPGRRGPIDDNVAAGELFFSAVAVTREARALVATFALATLGVVAALAAMPASSFGAYGMAGSIAYTAIAAATAFGYGRASKIAVGADGVLITGTSRTRFFAYRDLDGPAVTPGGDIVVRGPQGALRLQLHGRDAGRLAAIVARIQEGVAQASARAGDGVQRFAEAATAEGLARAARGEADYRARGSTRDDLWTLLESPATGSAERTAAASALAGASEPGDRARLTIVAERCAEPDVRATLLRLAAAAAETDVISEAPVARRFSEVRAAASASDGRRSPA